MITQGRAQYVTSSVIAGFLLKQAGLKRTQAHTGAVTLIQRFGSAANLNIICIVWCFSEGGYWRKLELWNKRARPEPQAPEAGSQSPGREGEGRNALKSQDSTRAATGRIWRYGHRPTVVIASVGCQLALAEVYLNVELTLGSG